MATPYGICIRSLRLTMQAPYKKPKKIKIVLLVILLIALGGVIVIYINSQQESKVAESIPQSVEPDTTLSIGKIQQTATRKGKKEWSLEAVSARYVDKTNQMILQDLLVTFYLSDKSEITLTADEGILNTDSNDIEVSGNVVLENKDYKLLTERLNYVHDKRLLYSKTPATISGTSVRVTADTLSYDLNTRQLTLEGSVETTLDDNFAL